MNEKGTTKNKILDLLKVKTTNLTSISRQLGLAPSTIKEHLSKLMNEGNIECIVFGSYSTTKTKYYRAKDSEI